ncbi:MAG: hypothetical protein WBQ23_15320 [Bacteroidota bacterium]
MNLHSPESGLRYRAQAMKQPPPVPQAYSYNYPPPISGIPGNILFILGFMIALTVVVQAQTEWTARPESLARNDQLKPSVAQPTQSDYTASVWEDERDLDTLAVDFNGSDIYIQKIDNITGVSQWIGDIINHDVVTDRFDGIPVCTARGDQRNPRAAYDGIGGVIVVWEDFRNGICEVYAQRMVLATGRPDPIWPVNGIAICQTGFKSERPRVVGTVDGAFITWIDYRNDPGSPPYNRDVFIHYIQSATATWPPAPTNWVLNGIQVPRNTGPDQINPELDSDNIFALDMLGQMTQGVVVTYQDDRYVGNYSGQPVWTVFANRIDANGVQMYTMGTPPWTADVSAGPSNEHQEYPRIVTTGKQPNVTNQSAIIVWQDMINDPAQGWTDIYSQCLDQFGMPQFPGPNGLMVCQAPSSQVLPQPTLWESGDPLLGTYIPYVTVGWLDYRNYALTGIDIYGGLIDARAPGMMMNPAGPAGEPVCMLPYDQTELTMDNLFYNDKNVEYTIFGWTHETGAGKDIWHQKIFLPGWIEQWPVNGWPISEGKSDQILPQANREVFVWQDGRRDPIPNDNQDDENIYCQTPGMCTGPTEMNWRDMFARWAFGTDAREFRYVTNPDDGSTFVVWTEDREVYNNALHSIVFIQKIDKDGVPRWSNNGVAVNGYVLPGGSANAKLPDVCISDQGSAMVVWQQTNALPPYNEECVAWKLDALGGRDPMGPFLMGLCWSSGGGLADTYTEPRIMANAGGSAVIAFLWANTSAAPPLITLPQTIPIASNGAFFPGNLATINTGIYTPYVTDNTDLRMVHDGIGVTYTMTRSLSQPYIVFGAYDRSFVPLGPPPLPQKDYTSAITYTAFDSYDLINRDYLLSPNFSDAAFTYSVQSQAGGSYDIYVGYFNYNFGIQSTAVKYNVTNNIPYVDSKTPAIAADSIINGQSGRQGVLVAWDTDTHVPGYPTTHRVETNRFKFPNAIQQEFSTHLIVANGLTAPTHPDIARVINNVPQGSPTGVVVWEGGGELSPCSPARPTDIYGQFVNYDNTSSNPGIQWAQAEMIAPGSGNYHQTTPTVDQSIAGGVSVFWYDSQTGNKGIMGTRMPELHSNIGWAKAQRADRQSPQTSAFSISDVWPQPAPSLGSELSIAIESPSDDVASLELYDFLGRKIATLFNGFMWKTGLVVRFTPADYNLAPGVYLLRLSNSSEQRVKAITLLR